MQYAVVVVKDGVVVRLLSKAVSRMMAELHVLSKGISLELISSFKYIHLMIFCGFISPQKLFNNKNFQTVVHLAKGCSLQTFAFGCFFMDLLLYLTNRLLDSILYTCRLHIHTNIVWFFHNSLHVQYMQVPHRSSITTTTFYTNACSWR